MTSTKALCSPKIVEKSETLDLPSTEQNTLTDQTPDEDNIQFGGKAKYKHKSITYEVTAHYSESGEDIRTKLLRLLCTDIKNENHIRTIAAARREC